MEPGSRSTHGRSAGRRLGLIFGGLDLRYLVAALFLLSTATAAAQDSEDLLHFEGHLEDQAGLPITADLPMTFGVYDQAEGGAALWSETFAEGQAVPVVDGLFAVYLGRRSELTAALFIGGPRYLGVAVDGVELVPRREVAGAAYAILARHAQVCDRALTLDDNAAAALATAEHGHPELHSHDGLVWTDANDGADSGLDADSVDGLGADALLAEAEATCGVLVDERTAEVTPSSGAEPPEEPVHGQLWFDTTTTTLRSWDGASWVGLRESPCECYGDAEVQAYLGEQGYSPCECYADEDVGAYLAAAGVVAGQHYSDADALRLLDEQGYRPAEPVACQEVDDCVAASDVDAATLAGVGPEGFEGAGAVQAHEGDVPHLTAEQHGELTAGGVTSLHKHPRGGVGLPSMIPILDNGTSISKPCFLGDSGTFAFVVTSSTGLAILDAGSFGNAYLSAARTYGHLTGCRALAYHPPSASLVANCTIDGVWHLLRLPTDLSGHESVEIVGEDVVSVTHGLAWSGSTLVATQGGDDGTVFHRYHLDADATRATYLGSRATDVPALFGGVAADETHLYAESRRTIHKIHLDTGVSEASFVLRPGIDFRGISLGGPGALYCLFGQATGSLGGIYGAWVRCDF